RWLAQMVGRRRFGRVAGIFPARCQLPLQISNLLLLIGNLFFSFRDLFLLFGDLLFSLRDLLLLFGDLLFPLCYLPPEFLNLLLQPLDFTLHFFAVGLSLASSTSVPRWPPPLSYLAENPRNHPAYDNKSTSSCPVPLNCYITTSGGLLFFLAKDRRLPSIPPCPVIDSQKYMPSGWR